MARQLIILAAVFAISSAVPVWYERNYVPNVFYRMARAPSVAYGFGSGFSTNIGGITHSTGISSAYNSGNGLAYGSGIGAANDNVFARGAGYAKAGPFYPYYYQPIASFYNSPPAPHYNQAVSSVQNIAGRGTIASAQSTGNGAAASTAYTNELGRYQTTSTSAQSARNGYDSGSSVSSVAQSGKNFNSAVTSVQDYNGSNYNLAVSAAEDINGVKASSAQTAQQRGLLFQNSGASSVNGPGIQAAQTHAVNNY